MNNRVTGSIADSVQSLLEEGGQQAYEYLRESFLANAMLLLFQARREADLTQVQLAEKLKTRQSAIARMENDTTGSISLRRFIEVALACGKMPFDISLAPLQDVVAFSMHNPEEERTEVNFAKWQSWSSTTLVNVEASPAVSIARENPRWESTIQVPPSLFSTDQPQPEVYPNQRTVIHSRQLMGVVA